MYMDTFMHKCVYKDLGCMWTELKQKLFSFTSGSCLIYRIT